MTSSRVARGRRSNVVEALYLQANGVPDPKPTFGSEPGRDVKNVPGLAIEVKARRDFRPLEWLRQAEANADEDLPVLIVRCDGQGEQSVGQWLWCMRQDSGIYMARKAGFW